MSAYYCTHPDDTSGPLTTAAPLTPGQRRHAPGHVLRNGNKPRIGVPGDHRAIRGGEEIRLDGEPDQHGGKLVSLAATGEPLRCPECLSPLRLSESAEVWTPPEIEPEPPSPEVVRPLQGSVVAGADVSVSATGEAWDRVGGLRTAAAAWLGAVPLEQARAGVVFGAVAVGGSLTVRLVEDSFIAPPRVLASLTLPAGVHPLREARSTVPPAATPCAYRVEAQVDGASSATLSDVSVALYEVLS